MKSMLLLMAVLLCLSGGVAAEELSQTYTRDIGTDTAAATVIRDTVYTDAFSLAEFYRMWFTVVIDSWGGKKDSNFANDTVYFKFQHGVDRYGLLGWVTRSDTIAKIGLTSADFDTVLQSGRFLDFDTTSAPFIQGWGRFMIIYRDSLEADAPGLLNKSFYKKFGVYTRGVKR